MSRATQVLTIIAEELKMPNDSSLNDILAALFLMDNSGEITKLLVDAGVKDLIDRYKEEGVIA